ncbi:MAG: hypothetical protein V4622_09345 [Bacteroidota bacterium]
MSFKNFSRIFALLFILLFTFTLPFPLQFIEHPAFLFEQGFISFEKVICEFFGLNFDFQGHFYSDSPDLLVHTFFLIFFSLLGAFFLSKYFKNRKIETLLITSSSYILAFFLIKYGFDKLFKLQFYAPEPNILFTPFGKLDKDILYWSTIGKSYSYNVFLGLLEIIPGILLFHHKTRKLGAFIAFGVLINVLMINISYQIEVKILSSFLVFLSLCILSSYWKEFFAFFIQNKTVPIREREELDLPIKLKPLLKFTLIFYIFFESIFLAFTTENFNDDLDKRPKFHGTYEIQSSAQEISDLFHLKQKVKRFFIHRQGYFILQTENDDFFDYKEQSFEKFNFITLDKPENIKIEFIKQKNNYQVKFESEKGSFVAKTLKIQ